METRGGSVIKSSLYTFNGFRSGLLFHSTIGVDDTYFYLGEEQFSTEAQELEIEYGIVNLALFMAKMKTDTIAYERCDPNLLACGMWSLDTAFSSQEQELRILCSSGDAGMECASESVGCACILGLLTHQIGAVDFCVLDPYQSICSRNINQGEELRWITAMTYWSYFVQRYSEDTGWVYLNSLRQFVRDGMIDVNFLDRVARMSIMKGPAESIETTSARPTTQQFVANFFKIIITLTDGASQLKPLVTSSPTTTKTPPTKTPTSVPSESPILSDPNPTDSSTDKPSFPPTNAQFIGDTIISNPPTKSPISEVETQSGLSEAKLCPFLCVVPVSTQECPAPDRELNLSGCLYINHNELCRASGECDTNASLNNCGNGLNIYRRVDCSVIGLTPVPTESGSPSSPTSFNTATTSWVSQESSSRPSGAIPSPVSSPPTSISSIAKPSVEDNAWYKSYWTSPSSASSHCFVGWKNIGIASCLFIMCDLF